MNALRVSAPATVVIGLIAVALSTSPLRAQPPGQTLPLKAQAALAEKQVAIKRTAVKIADVYRVIAEAKLKALKARADAARAQVAIAKLHLENTEQLQKQAIVSAREVQEFRAKLNVASAAAVDAESQVEVGAAEVLLETARRELAQAELAEAELRLQLLQDQAKAK